MKNILFFIALLVTPCFIHAQEHLDFRGIPIDGSLENMADQLAKLGYEKTDDDRLLMGEFIGKECTVVIMESEYTRLKNVYGISIFINKGASWHALKSDYFTIKELYTKKYGEGIAREEFERPYKDGDGYETLAIKNDKCHYITVWPLDNGHVNLGISVIGTECCIIIMYNDKPNSDENKKAKEQAFMNEI